MSLWLENGKVVVNAAGAPILCGDCPCDSECCLVDPNKSYCVRISNVKTITGNCSALEGVSFVMTSLKWFGDPSPAVAYLYGAFTAPNGSLVLATMNLSDGYGGFEAIFSRCSDTIGTLPAAVDYANNLFGFTWLTDNPLYDTYTNCDDEDNVTSEGGSGLGIAFADSSSSSDDNTCTVTIDVSLDTTGCNMFTVSGSDVTIGPSSESCTLPVTMTLTNTTAGTMGLVVFQGFGGGPWPFWWGGLPGEQAMQLGWFVEAGVVKWAISGGVPVFISNIVTACDPRGHTFTIGTNNYVFS